MTSTTENPLVVLADVGDVLDSIGARYAVVGSVASIAFGPVRTTMDGDILAELLPRQVGPLVELLGTAFIADEEVIRDSVGRRSSFNVLHEDLLFKVDVFLTHGSAFEQSQLDRRRRVAVSADPRREIYVVSPEDVIVSKLVWYRKGNEVASMQWRDVLGVLRVQAGRLDMTYLRRWAQDQGVADLLERALVAATG